MFFEFLETAFIIILISFVVVYIILGDRLDLARKIVVGVLPLTYFSIFFLNKQRVYRKKIKKALKQELNLEQIICSVREIDKRRDKICIILSEIVILGLALYGGGILIDDMAQALLVLLIMILRYLFLFTNKDKTEKEYLTIKDKHRDEFINYILPILMILIALFGKSADVIDTVQALAVFMIIYIWHNFLFSPRD
ncbi:hypothetical protein DRH27_05235 [Candidatus Falkowbacteria bacterium]|nr:MAG: hypothetical protein DRH27_05235 [Candidatus Falkowbacteria bacterium]